MKSMECENQELALTVATSAHKKVAWISVFKKILIPVYTSFIFKAKAFSFCLSFYTQPFYILATSKS